jgi:hypothetical protein
LLLIYGLLDDNTTLIALGFWIALHRSEQSVDVDFSVVVRGVNRI